MMTTCVHQWRLAPVTSAATVTGTCITCGANREFSLSLPKRGRSNPPSTGAVKADPPA